MKTKLFETQKQAIDAANELVNKSIEILDFSVLERSIMIGNDCKLAHLHIVCTEKTCDGYTSQLSDCFVNYNAKANKINHTHTPTFLLTKSFELITIVNNARNFAKETAKEDLRNEFKRIWIHNGKKFVQI